MIGCWESSVWGVCVTGQKWGSSPKTETLLVPWEGGGRGTKQPFMACVAVVRRRKLFTSRLFCYLPPCHCPPPLLPGTNTERYGRPSSTWCSPPRWPNTSNTSTSLWTASTSRWLRWRRTGWGEKRSLQLKRFRFTSEQYIDLKSLCEEKLWHRILSHSHCFIIIHYYKFL